MAKKKLSIIGCGNVAKTLAYLWHQAGVVEIIDVVNRSKQSAGKSVDFIGVGRSCSQSDLLRSADVFMIACADDQIESCLQQLLDNASVESGNIIFHCSGSKSHTVLKTPEKWGGVLTASLHPVKSFADPNLAISNFTNTFCGFEGDEEAVSELKKWTKAIGGVCFDIDAKNPQQKMLYHAATVFACNYLVALQELSIRAFAESGIERELAMRILEPIVKGTADNIFSLGTSKALTGPIARGDYKIVSEQLAAVDNWDSAAGEVYKLLGEISADLSEKQGSTSQEKLTKIRDTFKFKN